MSRRKKKTETTAESMWEIVSGELCPLDRTVFGAYGGSAAMELILGDPKFRRENEHHWLELNWHAGAIHEDSLKYHSSLEGALEELQSRHSNDMVWYRGQRQRYCAHSPIVVQHGAEDYLVFDLHMDSMLPSGFRGKMQESNVLKWDEELLDQFLHSQDLHHIAFLLRRVAAQGNDEMKAYIAQCLREHLAEPWRILWWQVTRGGMIVGNVQERGATAVKGEHQSTVPDWLCRCISLAQHYENPSFMTDVTADPDVAGWFSNCRWDSGNPIQTSDEVSQGVIYRFDMGKFSEGMRMNFQSMLDDQPAAERIVGCFGVTDIQDIPVSIAKRPSHQKGGSIFGTESFMIMAFMQKFGALEAHVFPHSGKHVGKLRRDDLVPPSDPANEVLMYGNHYNNAMLTELEITDIGRSLSLDSNEIDQLIWLSFPRSIDEVMERLGKNAM